MAPMLGIMASAISGNLFAPSGAYDSIATTTLSTTQSSITFSSIPSTYTHLQLRYLSRDNRATSSNGVRMRLNSDTGNNYSWHYLIGGGASVSVGSTASNDAFYIGEEPSASASASMFAGGVIDILDYKSTSKNKTIRVLQGFDMNGSGAVEYWSGAWYNSSTAVNSITIFFDGSASAVQYSSFALYGIKGE